MAEAKFEVIKRHITAKIESKAWAENAKVPSENELALKFNVSRMTARRALQDLTEQGLLKRTQGLGTFVACLKTQSSVLKIRNIADEIQQRGHQHQAHVISLSAIKAPTAIGIALELTPNAQVFHSQLVHCENDIPLQLEDRYVNALLVPKYLEQDFSQMTPHVYLSQIAPLTEARHTIEAISPSEAQCKLLQLDNFEPCLQITRHTYSAVGVVSVARITCPGSRYRLESHITI